METNIIMGHRTEHVMINLAGGAILEVPHSNAKACVRQFAHESFIEQRLLLLRSHLIDVKHANCPTAHHMKAHLRLFILSILDADTKIYAKQQSLMVLLENRVSREKRTMVTGRFSWSPSGAAT